MNNFLEIKNLKKFYHDDVNEILAIDDLSINVKKGEFVAIVGPSGCGKSTLLSIISKLDDKSNGEINLNSDNKRIGYMLQKDSLFPWLTVKDNALLGLDIYKEKNEENINRVIDLLNNYGLNEFIDKYPDSLSGGMRQRVALIRTIAINPNILLLDESFSALDYQTRLALSDAVYKIIKDFNITTIMVTHDIAEAISMADRIIVLTKRPAKIKSIYNIELTNKSTPIENRKAKEFSYYYEKIWKDLDVHV